MRRGLDININQLDFADENLISLNLKYYFEMKIQIMFKLKTKSVYNLLKNILSAFNINLCLQRRKYYGLSTKHKRLTDKVVFYNILYCIFFL